MYLKHTPSCGGSGSPYILNTPPPYLVISVHHMWQTRSVIGGFRVILYLKHAFSFGDIDQSYISNTGGPTARRLAHGPTDRPPD